MILQPKCSNCGQPLKTIRVKDEKWQRRGRIPREGRAVLMCEGCYKIPKRIPKAILGGAKI